MFSRLGFNGHRFNGHGHYVQKQPLQQGLRNEQRWRDRNAFDRFLLRTREWLRSSLRQLYRSDARMVAAIIRQSEALQPLNDDQLEQQRQQVRMLLRKQGIHNASLVAAFAVIRETSRRVLGMAHHHTQIRASIALLRGAIAEMATGEGKTLAATLAAATAGMAGIPVHVVTVNDYLAERDAEEMIPLYHALGLSVGVVIHERELHERRAAYACDLCYCSNKELVFDYLKDRIVLDGRENVRALQMALLTNDASWQEKLLLRGLHFAIVDEADSVFIDESRTPLIISGNESFGSREETMLRDAMNIAARLEEKIHYHISDTRPMMLTAAGKQKVQELAQGLDGIWHSALYREPVVVQALTALHVYHLDEDYIIDEEGCIQIVDPYTGRVMPGRSWGQGLQQMIEMKEGVELTKPRETQAEISYQNYFRKYAGLAGMTGTGKEVASELFDVYGLRSENIPLLRKSKRQRAYREVYLTRDQKWQRVADIASELSRQGQAVLIGTASVASSEAISAVLEEKSIAHRVLNARQDSEEADIVAQAGQPGSVMVATSMAGRGTDIKLTATSREAGGLHVIITELQDSSRVDRQLAGRSARQGDPGFVSEVLSLEDAMVAKMAGPGIRFLNGFAQQLGHKQRYRMVRRCQQRLEKNHFHQRMDLLSQDTHRQKLMAFAGRKD